MRDTRPTVADDLWLLLHPADDRDVPVPGFPSGHALVAWAQEQPREELIGALVRTLAEDRWPQQYAAMAALRGVGVDVRGVRNDDGFVWEVANGAGDVLQISPDEPSEADFGEVTSRSDEPAVASTTSVPVEPVVSEEKLRVLLAEQHESASLDFKSQTDLSDKRSTIELAKDVAAMQVEGGFIVIGVDHRGHPTGEVTPPQARLFDESRLRSKLTRWLPEPLELRSAVHIIDGHLMVLLYVAPNPAGFVVMMNDGRYANDQPLVFRRGDVFVRHGTASEIWTQRDIDRIIARRVARSKEEWRAELTEEIRRLGIASTASEVVTAPATALTWQVDAETFDSTIIELLRRDDDVPLRLLLGRAASDVDRQLRIDDQDGLATLLDRLLELASLAGFAARDQWVRATLDEYERVYTRGFGHQQHQTQALLWMNLLARVFALGGLLVRNRRWSLIPSAVLRRPHGLHDLYLNWVRHAHTQAARKELPGPDDEGRRRHLSFVDLGARVAGRIEAARIDGASDEDVLDSVAQFDALAALAAMRTAEPSDHEFRAYYPTFYLWYSHRVEPIFTQLIDDEELRGSLLPDASDAELAALLATLSRPPSNLWAAAPWFGYENPRLRQFIEGNTAS